MSDSPTSAVARGDRALGTLLLADGDGVRYTFAVHALRAEVAGQNGVFGYARLEGSTPVLLYLEAADDLAARLRDCLIRERAATHGASYLLVHIPDDEDHVPAPEAAERLICAHRPALNARRVAAVPAQPTALQQAAGRE